MNARIVLLAAAAAAALATAPAGAATPQAGARGAIDRAVASTNSNDPAQVAANFAPDAVIVDENAPFVWRGANAGAAWWHSVQHAVAGGSLHASAGPLVEYRTDKAGDDAYAVVPLHITVSLKGKTINESGLWALTLHRFAAGWKITTASWATAAR